jgi:hypothetical protein
MRMIIVLNLFVLIPVKYSYGGNPNPFDLLKKFPDLMKHECGKNNNFIKFNRSKQIVDINLYIGDYIPFSGDAKALGIEVDHRPLPPDVEKPHNNLGIEESFVDSIKKYNPDKEIALYVDDEKTKFLGKCLKKESNSMEKCWSKSNSYISAKYGNALIRFNCSLSVKGKTYPILLQSGCYIKAGEKKFSRGQELTDINAFEETSIKQAIKRLLDEHAKNLSKFFDVANLCKE